MPLLELRLLESDHGPYRVRYDGAEYTAADLKGAVRLIVHKLEREARRAERRVLRGDGGGDSP